MSKLSKRFEAVVRFQRAVGPAFLKQIHDAARAVGIEVDADRPPVEAAPLPSSRPAPLGTKPSPAVDSGETFISHREAAALLRIGKNSAKMMFKLRKKCGDILLWEKRGNECFYSRESIKRLATIIRRAGKTAETFDPTPEHIQQETRNIKSARQAR